MEYLYTYLDSRRLFQCHVLSILLRCYPIVKFRKCNFDISPITATPVGWHLRNIHWHFTILFRIIVRGFNCKWFCQKFWHIIFIKQQYLCERCNLRLPAFFLSSVRCPARAITVKGFVIAPKQGVSIVFKGSAIFFFCYCLSIHTHLGGLTSVAKRNRKHGYVF